MPAPQPLVAFEVHDAESTMERTIQLATTTIGRSNAQLFHDIANERIARRLLVSRSSLDPLFARYMGALVTITSKYIHYEFSACDYTKHIACSPDTHNYKVTCALLNFFVEFHSFRQSERHVHVGILHLLNTALNFKGDVYRIEVMRHFSATDNFLQRIARVCTSPAYSTESLYAWALVSAYINASCLPLDVDDVIRSTRSPRQREWIQQLEIQRDSFVAVLYRRNFIEYACKWICVIEYNERMRTMIGRTILLFLNTALPIIHRLYPDSSGRCLNVGMLVDRWAIDPAPYITDALSICLASLPFRAYPYLNRDSCDTLRMACTDWLYSHLYSLVNPMRLAMWETWKGLYNSIDAVCRILHALAYHHQGPQDSLYRAVFDSDCEIELFSVLTGIIRCVHERIGKGGSDKARDVRLVGVSALVSCYKLVDVYASDHSTRLFRKVDWKPFLEWACADLIRNSSDTSYHGIINIYTSIVKKIRLGYDTLLADKKDQKSPKEVDDFFDFQDEDSEPAVDVDVREKSAESELSSAVPDSFDAVPVQSPGLPFGDDDPSTTFDLFNV